MAPHLVFQNIYMKNFDKSLNMIIFATMKRRILIVILMAAALMAWAGQPSQPDKDGLGGVPLVKLKADSLPSLNIARAGHQLFYTNGEMMVAGGHTHGFVPTPTAEYLKDGEWHQLPMAYNHDTGFHIVLRSGKVLLGGGCAEPIGIGQTFLAELYDPATHSFDGFNCMEHKRTAASALEMENGKVVIAGNWYHDDAIEMYDTLKRHFTFVRRLSTPRCSPYILQTAADDAVIVGSASNRGDTIRSSSAYRLRGDSIRVPLLEHWRFIASFSTNNSACGIGNEAKGRYTYLVPVYNEEGQVAIAKVDNGQFSLLATQQPVPMKALGQEIEYHSNIVADRKAGRAYMMGCNRSYHQEKDKPVQYFVLAIDYAKATDGKSAPLTLYYTQPLNTIFDTAPILTAEGNLVLAGGMLNNSNFSPSAEVWLLPTGTPVDKAGKTGFSAWWWVVVVMAVAAVAAWLAARRRSRLQADELQETARDLEKGQAADGNSQLMERIQQMIEQERLYLNSNLKIADIAKAFNMHRNDISACINSQTGGTFAQYINHYRIEHAKQLMHEQPDMKISSVWLEAGFGSEQTFFKTFRAITGLSPKEWMAQQFGSSSSQGRGTSSLRVNR